MIEKIKEETMQEIKNYNKEFYDYLVSKEFKILYKFSEDEKLAYSNDLACYYEYYRDFSDNYSIYNLVDMETFIQFLINQNGIEKAYFIMGNSEGFMICLEDEIFELNDNYSSVSSEYSFAQLIKKAYKRIFEEDDFVKMLVKYLYCLELEKEI